MTNIDTLIELTDTEVLRMEKVLRLLNDRSGKTLNLEAFRVETVERFADAGFGVFVKTYETNQPGMFAFDIEIRERLAGQFDPDQQVAEVTNDILDLGTGGVINSHGGLWTPPGSA